MTEWQDYENITNQLENVKKVEVILAKEKPSENVRGLIMDTAFHYVKPDDGSKLWIRFWE